MASRIFNPERLALGKAGGAGCRGQRLEANNFVAVQASPTRRSTPEPAELAGSDGRRSVAGRDWAPKPLSPSGPSGIRPVTRSKLRSIDRRSAQAIVASKAAQ